MNYKTHPPRVVADLKDVAKTTLMNIYPDLEAYISDLNPMDIPASRKPVLQEISTYIQHKKDNGETAALNFICTHNSRRSQFSQVWAAVAAHFYGIPIQSYSGGVEVTALNERVVKTLKDNGFHIESGKGSNPKVKIQYSPKVQPIITFSKLFDDKVNHAEKFAAIMTCSDADENCPFIPGTEKRISLKYEDPKEYDDTPFETFHYADRSYQIANELFYVFSQIK